jgi:hypothetical protein
VRNRDGDANALGTTEVPSVGAVVVDEMGLRHGARRADVAVIGP